MIMLGYTGEKKGSGTREKNSVFEKKVKKTY